MKKKIIIDLNGVVFEPLDARFSKIAREKYGAVKGAAVTLAYKYGLGRCMFKTDIADVYNICAGAPVVRAGVLDALDGISNMSDVTLEFCGQVAFPGQEKDLEQKYRAIAPCMNAAAHYELVSPFKSKRDYLFRSTGADKNAVNFILGTHSNDLDWPSRWRIIPVLIEGASSQADIHRHCRPHVFINMSDFHNYLMRCR